MEWTGEADAYKKLSLNFWPNVYFLFFIFFNSLPMRVLGLHTGQRGWLAALASQARTRTGSAGGEPDLVPTGCIHLPAMRLYSAGGLADGKRYLCTWWL